MKISLSWIFDHIPGSFVEYGSVDALMALLVKTGAEIDGVFPTTSDLDRFALGRVTKINAHISVECPEWKKNFELPVRPDAQVGELFLVFKDREKIRWATLADIGGEKETLISALYVADAELTGDWKKRVDQEDVILEIDNKSIGNRPDLWGHRGFARELAAALGKEMISDDEILSPIPVKHFDESSHNGAIAVSIATPACKRIACYRLDALAARASDPAHAFRLARIGARPIDFLVDLSNIVMFDIAQPVHVFDADTLPAQNISARWAQPQEKIALLDGTTVELSEYDVVIASGEKAVGVAGIMGGSEAAVSRTTKNIVIEAGVFDSLAVRKTSGRLKKRSEAAVRFEKGVDHNANTAAIARYLKLLSAFTAQEKFPGAVISVGPLATETTITVRHADIVSKIGVTLTSPTIVSLLTAIGFGVHAAITHDDIVYHVTVPTFRARDVTIAEDIIEEVARLFGLDAIVPELPLRAMAPFDLRGVLAVRAIKNHCAFTLDLHEAVNYALYDEQWLREIRYQPQNTLALKNPVASDRALLVTSLIPHLVKNCAKNRSKYERLGFFEWGRIFYTAREEIIEKTSCASVVFIAGKNFDWYREKARVQSLFDMLHLPVIWQKPRAAVSELFVPELTAEIIHEMLGVVGYAGVLNRSCAAAVGEGTLFAFELDGDLLRNYRVPTDTLQPLAKYQAVTLDVSMLVPYAISTAALEHSIAFADPRIREVRLHDFFEKSEWEDRRSITVRFVVADDHKTLTKEEIDAVWESVISRVKALGADIR